MGADWSWMSSGGLLIDGSGDIASTAPTTIDDVRSVIYSRLKAALNGWQLYAMGADLEYLAGSTISQELEITIQRQVQQSLTSGLLPRGSFSVQTLTFGDSIQVLVYLNSTLIAQASISDLATSPSLTVVPTS